MAAFWDARVASYEQLVADLAAESAWNVATIGGILLPGVTRLEGEVGRKIEVNAAPGTDGATIVDKGFDPAKPTFSLLLWMPAHYDAYRVFLDRYGPKPGKSAQKPTAPLKLIHPGANDLGINAIIITSVAILRQGSLFGTMEGSIKSVQWLKPKLAPITTPQFSIDNVGGVTNPPAGSAGAPGNPGPYHQ